MKTLLIIWISEKKQLTITNTIGNRHAQCTTMQACIVGLFVCTDNLISTDLTYLPYTNWFLFYKIIFYSEEDEENN